MLPLFWTWSWSTLHSPELKNKSVGMSKRCFVSCIHEGPFGSEELEWTAPSVLGSMGLEEGKEEEGG